jgi:hypothetical protein
MRQVRLLATLIFAVFAVSAVASATASAALPEFSPGAAGTTLKGTGGKGKLEIKGEPPVSCEKTEATGELIGTTKKEAKATVTFKECTAFTFFGAESLGNKNKEIVTKVHLKLCYIKKGTPLEVGILTKLDEPVHIEVAGKLLSVTGDQVGLITPLKTKTTKYTITYTQAAGQPKPEGCEGEKEHYSTEINESGKPLESGEETTVNGEFSAAQELLD